MADHNVVTLDNLGTGFDIDAVAQKINVVPGGGQIKTLTVERNYLGVGEIDIQDINDNGVITFTTNTRLDSGWSQNNDALLYTGEPDRVRINVQIAQTIAQNANIQRAAPQVSLTRNGTEIARSSTGYIRDSNDHEESSSTIVFTDPTPGVNPEYALTSIQESTNGGVVTVVIGSFSAEAVELEECDVLVPSSAGGSATPTLPASNGKVVSDNFQDQFGSFNLQVRNTTDQSVNWEALVAGVPYASIPNLVPGNYSVSTADNGDGTYDHLFTGTTALAAFANINIDGDGPTPVGNGSGLSLYCA